MHHPANFAVTPWLDARRLRMRLRLAPRSQLSERSYLFTMSDSASARALRSNGCTELLRERAEPDWWSQTGSNRRPPACKAGALPTELWPLAVGPAFSPRLKFAKALRQATFVITGLPAEAAPQRRLVGLGRLELPTSRLSSARSNQLSYKPAPGFRSQSSVVRTWSPIFRLPTSDY